MADLRAVPYLWVTWLAKAMSGDNPCLWQAWFLSHNKLTEKVPTDFNLIEWRIDHTRRLVELTQELQKQGSKDIKTEVALEMRFKDSGTKLAGKADCICVENGTTTIYDCKTGKERDSDQVQVMLYLWLYAAENEGKEEKINGCVVYNKRRLSIPQLTDRFKKNAVYFVNLLTDKHPPTRSPGTACRFCDITSQDCDKRITK